MPPRLRYSTSEASSLESRTRSDHGFPDAEASLLSIGQAKISKSSKIRDLLSFLGPRNPLPAPVHKNDVVWLFDNIAFRGPSGDWQAEFVSATFAGKVPAKFVDVVGDIGEMVGIARGDAEEAVVERRIVPFVLDILPGKQVKVRHDGNYPLKLGPGGRNGISSDLKKVPRPPKSMVVESSADVPNGTLGILDMKTVYAEPEGWSIISDVDDTIKLTMTSDPKGILRSTFVDEPKPVPGMPQLYGYIQSLVTKSAPWFYLSASPYNLYSFLHDFRDAHYPHGQLILRDSSWMTISGLLSSLTLGTERYKIDRITKVHNWLPKRKMILIGDSTQSDPESYGECFREFPGWIKLILIRRVTDIASVGLEEKNAPARFENAFEGVPKEAWHVFDDPAECIPLIDRVVKADKK